MADVRSEWEQVTEKLSGLGLKLKLHFEQAANEGRKEDEDKVKENLRKVGDAVDQTFTALGAASRDEAVREDVKDVGRSFIEALDATFSELGDRFRSTVKHDEDSAEVAGDETVNPAGEVAEEAVAAIDDAAEGPVTPAAEAVAEESGATDGAESGDPGDEEGQAF